MKKIWRSWQQALDIQSAHGDVFLNGRNVTAEIRIDRVTTATRFVADAPSVREEMKKMQRSLSEEFDLVTEGRDQGTIVFPDAELKIYLDASPAARAARRYRERVDLGDQSRTVDEILHSQLQRDQGDRNRPVGAMAVAIDAIIIKHGWAVARQCRETDFRMCLRSRAHFGLETQSGWNFRECG